jgi:putative transposase
MNLTWPSYCSACKFRAIALGAEAPWKGLRGQVLLGSEAFVARVGQELARAGELREVPRMQRYAHRPALDVLFPADEARTLPERDERIWRANREYGYSLSEIGRSLELHYSTVSKAIARFERSQF